MRDEDKRKHDQSGDGDKPGDEPTEDGAGAEEELTVDDILAEAPDNGQAAEDTVSVLQTTLEERTRDLQRLSAEFQNYRKRVERDKARAGEVATAAVLASLLPVLDDLDRAREHGDLNGPFGSVAEQLTGALGKHGLESFGDAGDAFDPTVHEAVAHMQMGDVEGPTCIDVMRRGYRLGDRLLRPALVAVAEPLDDVPGTEPEGEAEREPEAEADAEPAAESEAESADAAGERAEAEAGEDAEADAEAPPASDDAADESGGDSQDTKGEKDS